MAIKPQERHHLDKTILTPANIVTMVRIVLIPVFVFVLLAPWPAWVPDFSWAGLLKPYVAAAVFALLALTDGVDGYLARSRNEVTTFGKFLDPIADKILVTAALLALIELGVLPTWVVLIIIAREFLISGLRMVVVSEGEVISASILGKAKTVVQIIAILLFIVMTSPLLAQAGEKFQAFYWYLSWTVMFVALALTVVSLLDYLIGSADALGFKVHKPQGEQEAAAKPTLRPSSSCESAVLSSAAIAASVISAATARKLKLATAESCTGGLVAAALTSVAGSSEVFEGAVVSYANEVKVNSLGVEQDALNTSGAVSSAVALQMASGAASKLQADIAVSITGIAGPGGGSQSKPVGTVWFGLANRGELTSELRHFEGDRDSVRTQAAAHSLRLLQSALQ